MKRLFGNTNKLKWTLRTAIGALMTFATTSAFAGSAEAEAGESQAMYYFLLGITGLLVLLTVSKTMKVLEMAYEAGGKERRKFNWNKINGAMLLLYMFAFVGGTVWEMFYHGGMIFPESASEHGVLTDSLFMVTFGVTVVVFIITHILLFFFAYKYKGSPDRKAFFYADNNKLEAWWTIIPAVVMAVLVITGMKTWNQITDYDQEDIYTEIEVFAYQFGWSTRYPGNDGVLGKTNYNMISVTNPLGILTQEDFDKKSADLVTEIAMVEKRMADLEAELGNTPVESGDYVKVQLNIEDQQDIWDNRTAHIERLGKFSEKMMTNEFFAPAKDDVIERELVLPVGKTLRLSFRARDVIHSAYMPDFRLQMNCVPGMPTQFIFTPRLTTEEMREVKGDETFDYSMICAKICGTAHFNMQMKVTVVSEADYKKWLATKTPYYVDQHKAMIEEAPVTEQTEEAMVANF
ncbi:MAG: cytochrome c oxidase subunit 2 [Sphingobacteriales bacterium]|jgi:cytochrome c oxidase subunit 2